MLISVFPPGINYVGALQHFGRHALRLDKEYDGIMAICSDQQTRLRFLHRHLQVNLLVCSASANGYISNRTWTCLTWVTGLPPVLALPCTPPQVLAAMR